MDSFGRQDTIRIGDREFRIHTGCDTNKNKAVTEVFEAGNFLFNNEKSFQIRQRASDTINETYLKKAVHELHKQMLDEVTLLFQINEKIQTVNHYMPHHRLGRVFLAKGFQKEAIDNLKRVIQINPDNTQAYKLLGSAYIQLNEYKNALKIFSLILDKVPEYPDILNARAVLYIQMGNYEAAKNDLQQAISIKPDLLECNFNMGVLLFLSTLAENPRNDIPVIPARIIRSIKELKNEHHYNDENWHGEFDQALGKIEKGNKNAIIESLYDLQIKMISNENFNTDIDLFFLRFMYGGREVSREEINYYERIILSDSEKFEEYADYWNDLAILHLIQCRDSFLKAINDFEQSTKINPKYEDANKSLEMVKHGKKGFLILLRAILK